MVKVNRDQRSRMGRLTAISLLLTNSFRLRNDFNELAHGQTPKNFQRSVLSDSSDRDISLSAVSARSLSFSFSNLMTAAPSVTNETPSLVDPILRCNASQTKVSIQIGK